MDLETRIQKAGYKLGGQIVVLDNGKRLAENLALKCELLLNSLEPKLTRYTIKEVNELISNINHEKNQLEYAYKTAIKQNMNIRSILEKGEEIDWRKIKKSDY